MNKPLVVQGAVGSFLLGDAVGCPCGGQIPDMMLVECPERVESMHRRYLEAGADVLVTDTFLAAPGQYSLSASKAAELCRLGVSVARDASDAARGEALVAASVAPLPMSLASEQAQWSYQLKMDALLSESPDFLLLETFTSTTGLLRALESVPESDTPLVVSLTPGADGIMSEGDSVEECVRVACDNARIAAFGINCVYPPSAARALAIRLSQVVDQPLWLRPAASLPGNEALEGLPDCGFAIGLPRQIAAMGWCCGSDPALTASLCRVLDTDFGNYI